MKPRPIFKYHHTNNLNKKGVKNDDDLIENLIGLTNASMVDKEHVASCLKSTTIWPNSAKHGALRETGSWSKQETN